MVSNNTLRDDKWMNAKLSQDVDPCGKDSGKKEAFAPTEASGFEGKG